LSRIAAGQLWHKPIRGPTSNAGRRRRPFGWPRWLRRVESQPKDARTRRRKGDPALATWRLRASALNPVLQGTVPIAPSSRGHSAGGAAEDSPGVHSGVRGTPNERPHSRRDDRHGTNGTRPRGLPAGDDGGGGRGGPTGSTALPGLAAVIWRTRTQDRSPGHTSNRMRKDPRRLFPVLAPLLKGYCPVLNRFGMDPYTYDLRSRSWRYPHYGGRSTAAGWRI
jgi:hypothetical protein